MNNPLNVLIVEDEPLIINSLEIAFEKLSESNGELDFNLKSVTNSNAALLEIQRAVNGTPLDLVLLDINIPPSSDNGILSGEDLGLEIQSLFPRIKIIVFTYYSDNFRLNSILKSLNPDGFLIKSEIDFDGLLEAITSVIFDPPYYSKAVLRLIRRHVTNDFVLDKIDRQLLYHLSKGVKTKDLPDLINLSKSGIERRKRNLKDLFCIEHGNDRQLLKLAEEKGFI